MKLSVIIITKNEAANLGACLASVAFADEIIVLDSGSTDNTLDIARFHGAKVHSTTDWPGFGPQKNRALALATGDWVLSIDADERVTPELAGKSAKSCRHLYPMPTALHACPGLASAGSATVAGGPITWCVCSSVAVHTSHPPKCMNGSTSRGRFPP